MFDQTKRAFRYFFVCQAITKRNVKSFPRNVITRQQRYQFINFSCFEHHKCRCVTVELQITFFAVEIEKCSIERNYSAVIQLSQCPSEKQWMSAMFRLLQVTQNILNYTPVMKSRCLSFQAYEGENIFSKVENKVKRSINEFICSKVLQCLIVADLDYDSFFCLFSVSKLSAAKIHPCSFL